MHPRRKLLGWLFRSLIKFRGNSVVASNTGIWINAINKTLLDRTPVHAGATKTFTVMGTTIYLASARNIGGDLTTYTVSVDGNLVTDPISKSTIFDQRLDAPGVTQSTELHSRAKP